MLSMIALCLVPVHLKFDNQHGYTMVMGMCYSINQNLQLSSGSQYIHYINALIMDP